MKKTKFSREDKEKLKEAVRKAESSTSGEIAVAIVGQSSDYAVYELLFAVFIGFGYFLIMLFFIGPVEVFLQQLTWHYSVVHLISFYGFSTFLVITVFYLLANLRSIDRLIIPSSVKLNKVKNRAVRYFMDSGVYNTRDRTGILIFISYLEKRVEILADTGISDVIEQSVWDDILRSIVDGIKTDDLLGSLLKAVDECGKLLSDSFPIKPDDENELKDDIVVLEK
jgi:putative membrane protein